VNHGKTRSNATSRSGKNSCIRIMISISHRHTSYSNQLLRVTHSAPLNVIISRRRLFQLSYRHAKQISKGKNITFLVDVMKEWTNERTNE